MDDWVGKSAWKLGNVEDKFCGVKKGDRLLFVKSVEGVCLWPLESQTVDSKPSEKPDMIYTVLKLSCLNYMKLD